MLKMDYSAPVEHSRQPSRVTLLVHDSQSSPCALISSFPGKDTRKLVPCFKDVSLKVVVIC